jgi:hypothetical protein
MGRLRVCALVVIIAGSGACRDAKTAKAPPPKPVKDPYAADLATQTPATRVKAGHPIDLSVVPPDVDKDEYVPAEFKSGADRWRDTGVYLDGKPVGMLAWAELPLALKPTWIPIKAGDTIRAGHPEDKGWRWAKERHYKFTDYLRALGIEPGKVKELHVYGPKHSETIVVTGKDLKSKTADGFRFRFGGAVTGKALPVVPGGFGNGKSPDKIAAVMIYIDKEPPTLVRNRGFELDGVIQDGVPYYGEPLRGGIRVYLDDKMVAYLKRQDLPVANATATPDGQLHWKLYEVLALQGVKLETIVEGYVIRDNKRQERLTRDELATLTFEAGSQAKGSILIGPNKLAAKALAFHSRIVDPSELPQRDPVDE